MSTIIPDHLHHLKRRDLKLLFRHLTARTAVDQGCCPRPKQASEYIDPYRFLLNFHGQKNPPSLFYFFKNLALLTEKVKRSKDIDKNNKLTDCGGQSVIAGKHHGVSYQPGYSQSNSSLDPLMSSLSFTPSASHWEIFYCDLLPPD